VLIRRGPLIIDGCDGRAMSSTANGRFDLCSGDSSIPRDGEIRESVGGLLDGGGKGTKRDAERLLCKGPPDALATQADSFAGSVV